MNFKISRETTKEKKVTEYHRQFDFGTKMALGVSVCNINYH